MHSTSIFLSHKRDVGIPQPKLFFAKRFFLHPRKQLISYVLGLYRIPWHGHCNRGQPLPNYLNPSRPTDASH